MPEGVARKRVAFYSHTAPPTLPPTLFLAQKPRSEGGLGPVEVVSSCDISKASYPDGVIVLYV